MYSFALIAALSLGSATTNEMASAQNYANPKHPRAASRLGLPAFYKAVPNQTTKTAPKTQKAGSRRQGTRPI